MTVREAFRVVTLRKILAAAVVARLAMLVLFWGQPLSIVDEQHYDTIATNIVERGHFIGVSGQVTAIRPPGYPYFLSLWYRLFGAQGHDAVRIVQAVLSLVGGLFLYLMTRSVHDERVARLAAGLFLLYPSLLFFDSLILTEVLFTVLFLAALAAISWAFRARPVLRLALAGVALGLATLTRSITYPMAVPLALLLILLLGPRMKSTWIAVGLFGVIFMGTLSPWIVRNYRVFGAFVPVDTMGGLNAFMGNHELTPLHRAWAAVDLVEPAQWYRGREGEVAGLNEAQKQAWASKQALSYMLAHPGLTVLRSVIKTANFWGMDRALIAAMQQNRFQAFRGASMKAVAGALILAAYAFVVVLGFAGLAARLLFERAALDVVSGFLLVYFTAMHALVFGHSRYHLPLIPILCVYAAWAVLHGRRVWETRRGAAKAIVGGVSLFFCAIWVYEVALGSKAELARLLSK